jgi:hypothetical protein
VDQSTRGIPGPPGHVPVAHSDGKGGGGVLEEGRRFPLLKIPFIPLFLSPSARTSVASDILSLVSQSCTSKTLVHSDPLLPVYHGS